MSQILAVEFRCAVLSGVMSGMSKIICVVAEPLEKRGRLTGIH